MFPSQGRDQMTGSLGTMLKSPGLLPSTGYADRVRAKRRTWLLYIWNRSKLMRFSSVCQPSEPRAPSPSGKRKPTLLHRNQPKQRTTSRLHLGSSNQHSSCSAGASYKQKPLSRCSPWDAESPAHCPGRTTRAGTLNPTGDKVSAQPPESIPNTYHPGKDGNTQVTYLSPAHQCSSRSS